MITESTPALFPVGTIVSVVQPLRHYTTEARQSPIRTAVIVREATCDEGQLTYHVKYPNGAISKVLSDRVASAKAPF